MRLVSIDTLMQSCPDSAFSQLQAFSESPLMDSLDAFNGHYFHLLLSELLYKNDYAQTNRNELLRAVDYYDSLMVEEGNCVHPDMAFLEARSHYINGVGYYEIDSVVPACEEYLKALEIMENHFDEKDLVGHKAKFMALTYVRLLDVFSDQFLYEQAIALGKYSLFYYSKVTIDPWILAWLLGEIGAHYDMEEQKDSAFFYYKKAEFAVNDTNSLIYRDIETRLTYLSYRTENDSNASLNRMLFLLSQAKSEAEHLARCLIIGEMYFNKTQWDSAEYYLKKVFDALDNDVDARIRSADFLRTIGLETHDSLLSNRCTLFLSQQANSSDIQASIHSRLARLYNDYELQKQYKQDQLQHKKQVRIFIRIVAILLLLFALCAITILLLKRRQFSDLKMQLDVIQDGIKKESHVASFLEEPICQLILRTVHEMNFKPKIDHTIYKDFALSEDQLLSLRNSVDYHFDQLTFKLRDKHPDLTDLDINYCCLYLLGLRNADCAALTQRAFSTVCERNRRIKKILGTKEKLSEYLIKF